VGEKRETSKKRTGGFKGKVLEEDPGKGIKGNKAEIRGGWWGLGRG